MHKIYQTCKQTAGLIVSGWIRDVHQMLHHAHRQRHSIYLYVPPSIQYIILSYYLIVEEWQNNLGHGRVVITNNWCRTVKLSKHTAIVTGTTKIVDGTHLWVFKTRDFALKSTPMRIGVQPYTCDSVHRKTNRYLMSFPYVSKITLCWSGNGAPGTIAAKIQITNADLKCMNVKFEFNYKRESVPDLISELVTTLDLNAARTQEIVKTFDFHLQKLCHSQPSISESQEIERAQNKLDTIQMRFDTSHKLLTFTVNDELYGTVKVNRDHDAYRMCVVFRGHPLDIQLWDYKQLR
mmetsp:Transcript_10653/g.15986  ORF Transcript_10653/g.15986 Transcript_10653/m.15986 type:complete len:293 (+) Transcript_10653:1-879(+)